MSTKLHVSQHKTLETISMGKFPSKFNSFTGTMYSLYFSKSFGVSSTRLKAFPGAGTA